MTTPEGAAVLDRLAAGADVLLDDGASGGHPGAPPLRRAAGGPPLARRRRRVAVRPRRPAPAGVDRAHRAGRRGWLPNGPQGGPPLMPARSAPATAPAPTPPWPLLALAARRRDGPASSSTSASTRPSCTPPGADGVLQLRRHRLAPAGRRVPIRHLPVRRLVPRRQHPHPGPLGRVVPADGSARPRRPPAYRTGVERADPAVAAELDAIVAELDRRPAGASRPSTGQAMRVPITIVASPTEVLASPQYEARGTGSRPTTTRSADCGYPGRRSGWRPTRSLRSGPPTGAGTTPPPCWRAPSRRGRERPAAGRHPGSRPDGVAGRTPGHDDPRRLRRRGREDRGAPAARRLARWSRADRGPPVRAEPVLERRQPQQARHLPRPHLGRGPAALPAPGRGRRRGRREFHHPGHGQPRARRRHAAANQPRHRRRLAVGVRPDRPVANYSAFAFPTEEASGLAYLNASAAGPCPQRHRSPTPWWRPWALAIVAALERRAATGEGRLHRLEPDRDAHDLHHRRAGTGGESAGVTGRTGGDGERRATNGPACARTGCSSAGRGPAAGHRRARRASGAAFAPCSAVPSSVPTRRRPRRPGATERARRRGGVGVDGDARRRRRGGGSPGGRHSGGGGRAVVGVAIDDHPVVAGVLPDPIEKRWAPIPIRARSCGSYARRR